MVSSTVQSGTYIASFIGNGSPLFGQLDVLMEEEKVRVALRDPHLELGHHLELPVGGVGIKEGGR